MSKSRARSVARKVWIERHGNPVCKECSASPADVHHVDGNYYNNEDSNHKPLCRKCHIAYENSIRCWVNNGERADRILRADFSNWINLGWSPGRKKKEAKKPKVFKYHEHGKERYRRGCRCPECFKAYREYHRVKQNVWYKKHFKSA
jgi:hypothetical protein